MFYLFLLETKRPAIFDLHNLSPELTAFKYSWRIFFYEAMERAYERSFPSQGSFTRFWNVENSRPKKFTVELQQSAHL